jgi:hypothetical protein
MAADSEDVASRLGTGRETAAVVQAVVLEKLRLATVDHDDADAVLA